MGPIRVMFLTVMMTTTIKKVQIDVDVGFLRGSTQWQLEKAINSLESDWTLSLLKSQIQLLEGKYMLTVDSSVLLVLKK